MAAVIYAPYHSYEIPARINGAQLVMKETARALKKYGYQNKEILFIDPKLAFFLGDDPYDKSTLHFRLPSTLDPAFGLPDSSYFIWDSHFAELEKNISLFQMLENPHYKAIDGFYPDKDYRSSTGMNYMSILFRKLPEKNQVKLDVLTAYLKDMTPETAKGHEVIISLSAMELRVAMMIKKGFSSEEIARLLHISPHTVKTHRRSIRKKLNLKNSSLNLSSYLKYKLGKAHTAYV